MSFKTCIDLYNLDYDRNRSVSSTLYPPPLLTPGNYWSVLHHYTSVILRMPKNRILQYSIFGAWLLSLSDNAFEIMPSRFFQVFVCINRGFLFWLSGISIYGDTIACLFILLVKEIWVVSSLEQCLADS